MTSVPGSKVPDKDVDLDRRMEAIRKKNEAIMKRYAEIQADKKHAEAEGMAVDLKAPPSPSRPPFRGGSQGRSSDEGKRLSSVNWATRDKERPRKDSDEDRRPRETTNNDTAMRKPKGVPPQERILLQRQEPRTDYVPMSGEVGRGFRGRGRGRGKGDRSSQSILQDKRCQEREEKRRLNIEKMSEEMELIADYERGQRDGRSEKNPVRNFLDDSWRTGPVPSRGGDRRQDSRRHRTNWGGADFEHVKMGMDRQRRQRQDGWARDGMSSEMHMQLSMTGHERVEYARWKHEREVIDCERLSRHRNAAGEWRREWDANKSENMFKENAGGAETDNGDGNVYQDNPRSPRPHNLAAFMTRPQFQNPAGRNRDYSMHDERWRDDTPAPSSKDVLQPVPADRPVQNRGRGRDDIPEGSDDGAITSSVASNDEANTSVPVSAMKPPRGRSTKAMRPKEQRTLRGQPALHLDLPERDPVIEGCERSQLDTGVKPSTPPSSISPGNGYQSLGDWADLVESASPQNHDFSTLGSDGPTFIHSTLPSHSADYFAAPLPLETFMPGEERDVEGAAETVCDNPVEGETPPNVQSLRAEEHHEATPDGCSPGERNTFVLEGECTPNGMSTPIPVESSCLDVPQPEVLAHANMEETMEGDHNISPCLQEEGDHNISSCLQEEGDHNISQSLHEEGDKNISPGLHEEEDHNISPCLHEEGDHNISPCPQEEGDNNISPCPQEEGDHNISRSLHEEEDQNISPCPQEEGDHNISQSLHEEEDQNNSPCLQEEVDNNISPCLQEEGDHNISQSLHEEGDHNISPCLHEEGDHNISQSPHEEGDHNISQNVHEEGDQNISPGLHEEGDHNNSPSLHEVSSHLSSLLPQQEYGVSPSDDASKDAEPPLMARCANVDGENDTVSKETDIIVCEKKACITEGNEAEHIPDEEDCSTGTSLADSEEVCCSNEIPSPGNAENVNAEVIEPAEGLGVGGDITVQKNSALKKNEASPSLEVSIPPVDEGESKTNVIQEGDLELNTDQVTERREDVSIDVQDKVAE
uniref:uncharacterized protein isoform X2 n=1 Tax=Myxine glutinosa TaxID=7769 RepID=UPI00359003C0